MLTYLSLCLEITKISQLKAVNSCLSIPIPSNSLYLRQIYSLIKLPGLSNLLQLLVLIHLKKRTALISRILF